MKGRRVCIDPGPKLYGIVSVHDLLSQYFLATHLAIRNFYFLASEVPDSSSSGVVSHLAIVLLLAIGLLLAM